MTIEDIKRVDSYCQDTKVSRKTALRTLGFSEGKYYASRKKLLQDINASSQEFKPEDERGYFIPISDTTVVETESNTSSCEMLSVSISNTAGVLINISGISNVQVLKTIINLSILGVDV